MSKCEYFTDEEIKGLTDDICFKLDRARELFGNPLVLTCGYRTPEHNAEIGGVPNSAHTKGMAVDLRAPVDHFQREKLAWALGRAGFRNVESAPKHFHAATDQNVPQDVFYPGDDH
jgi:zinc D-Ala-D-Ala carboxypeptidase